VILKDVFFDIPASHQIAIPTFKVLPGNFAAAFNHAIGMGPFKNGMLSGASMYLPEEESNLILFAGTFLSSIYIYLDIFIRMDGCGKLPQVVRLAASGQ